MYKVIQQMPKVDLHCHLDGSVSPRTLAQIARQQQLPLPEGGEPALLAQMQAGEDCRDLLDYLKRFDFVLPYLQTTQALRQATFDLVAQAAAEQVRYLEVRFAPRLHLNRGLSPRQAVQAVCQGLAEGQKTTGTVARAILIGMRHEPAQNNLALVSLAAEFAAQGVVAVDIAGDEKNFPPMTQRPLFEAAAEKGVAFTIHAGENGPVSNIRDAVQLGAARIGHGIRLRDDPALLRLVKQKGIGIEMCPTSNIQTRAVAGWQDYPVAEYLAAGLLVSINTDNRTVSGTTSTAEYTILAEKFAFTPAMLAQVVRGSLATAFLPEDEKAALTAKVETELADLGLT